MICRLCGCDINPDVDEPLDACPDCHDAEQDAKFRDAALRDAGVKPLGRGLVDVDDSAI
jgi:hypothetical protein